MVNVLPDDVYPYANMVPLKPCKTLSTRGLAANSYIYFCVVEESKTPSN